MGRQKLSDGDVVAIRDAYAAGERVVGIAERYGIHVSYVGSLVSGKKRSGAGGIILAPRKVQRECGMDLHDLARHMRTRTVCWAPPSHMIMAKPCRLWLGGRGRDGYGAVRHEGRKRAAHRLVYLGFHGELPAEKPLVLHHCDRPQCIEVEHLYPGTAQDNCDDKFRRGRNSPQAGKDNGNVKLTEEQVLDIRKRAAAGEAQRAIARQMGLNSTTVFRIVSRKLWPHLEAHPADFISGATDICF